MFQSIYRRLTNRPAISDEETSEVGGDVVGPILEKQDSEVEDKDITPAAITGDLDDDEEDGEDGEGDDEDLGEDEYVAPLVCLPHTTANRRLTFGHEDLLSRRLSITSTRM